MAKDRLTLQDKYGNERPYDVSSEDITLDNENGKSLKNKLGEIDDAIGESVKKVTFNGQEHNANDGKIDIGEQMQADWNESSTNYPTYIRNKPTIPSRTSQLTNDSGFITQEQVPAGTTVDTQMSSTSENAVQNKVIKAYVDAVSQRIDTLIGSGNVQGAIDTFNEVVAFLDGINSSDTLAAKLLLKADKSTTYTKTETDNAIANAVEGLGGGSVESVTINGTNHTPTNGVVDLGTIQGQPGAQGPAGNTYLVDENFDPVSMIINNLDESDGTVALSARQGKILKGNVDALWTKVNALINDLAAMAFTGNKTSGLGSIDWTGGTFYATINKSLTGCTATDNTTNGQIAEGSTLTMQLTASSGYTLTGATISVTDSRGQAVAYTLNGSTLSVANVMGTITISVVAVAVYSVANNDTHVDMATQTPNPVAGSSWSGTLSLKGSVSGYRLATTPSVTMGGVAVDFTLTGNSWNPSTGAMTIGEVTGNIVILEAAVEIVAHTITKKLLNVTSSNTTGDTTDADFGYKKQSVEDGTQYQTTLAAVTGATSNNDVVVKMGGVDITSTAFNSSTGVVNIPSVTGDVVIVATAATGVIKVTSNAAVTGGITINGTAHDLTMGDTTINGITAITALVFSADAKTAITALDFGGAVSSALGFGGTAQANACSALEKLEGFVYKNTSASFRNAFLWCSALFKIDTIGWHCDVDSFDSAFANTALRALDLEDFISSATTTLKSLFYNVPSLKKVLLPVEIANLTSMEGTFMDGTITEHPFVVSAKVTTLKNHIARNQQIVELDLSGLTGNAMTDMSFMCNACTSLKKVIIGKLDTPNLSTTTAAFNSCNQLSALVCTSEIPPEINTAVNWLSALPAGCHIYVPASAVETYKAATGWSAVAGRIHSINEYTE